MKLHIGCGSVHIPEYVNVDIRYLPNVDVVDNAEFLRKFEREEITEIYACHILEHFNRWRIPNILRRWWELLQPGGLLYLSVPNFEAIVSYYNKTRDLKLLIGLLYGGQDYDENFHHICWDFNLLKMELVTAGFYQVALCQIMPCKDLDDYSKCYLPHKNKENGMLMSLNIRAEKRK